MPGWQGDIIRGRVDAMTTVSKVSRGPLWFLGAQASPTPKRGPRPEHFPKWQGFRRVGVISGLSHRGGLKMFGIQLLESTRERHKVVESLIIR